LCHIRWRGWVTIPWNALTTPRSASCQNGSRPRGSGTAGVPGALGTRTLSLQTLAQEFLGDLGVRRARGLLHQLSDEEADHAVFAIAELLYDIGVLGDHGIGELAAGIGVGPPSQPQLRDRILERLAGRGRLLERLLRTGPRHGPVRRQADGGDDTLRGQRHLTAALASDLCA